MVESCTINSKGLFIMICATFVDGIASSFRSTCKNDASRHEPNRQARHSKDIERWLQNRTTAFQLNHHWALCLMSPMSR